VRRSARRAGRSGWLVLLLVAGGSLAWVCCRLLGNAWVEETGGQRAMTFPRFELGRAVRRTAMENASAGILLGRLLEVQSDSAAV